MTDASAAGDRSMILFLCLLALLVGARFGEGKIESSRDGASGLTVMPRRTYFRDARSRGVSSLLCWPGAGGEAGTIAIDGKNFSPPFPWIYEVYAWR
jgi:hypothetical protein